MTRTPGGFRTSVWMRRARPYGPHTSVSATRHYEPSENQDEPGNERLHPPGCCPGIHQDSASVEAERLLWLSCQAVC